MAAQSDAQNQQDGSSADPDIRPPRDALENFHIQWNPPAWTAPQSFNFLRSSRQMFSLMQFPVPQSVSNYFQWPDHGGRFSDLWYTEIDTGNAGEWSFAHYLGKGGYGAVAQYDRRDTQTNAKVDQIVLKTTKARASYAVNPFRTDLALEAALMEQTNNLDPDGMVVLRNYKCYRDTLQWRFYFEYCPYGDLERLRVRYKAYGRYLPELFLWHMFYWLASTVNQYSDINNWRDTSEQGWGDYIPGGYLVHFDIKTNNILLGPPDPNTDYEYSFYPIPRIADLGLARILQPNDRNNIAARLQQGTTAWYPPELRYDSIDHRTDFYPWNSRYLHPDRTNVHRKGYHPITSRANVWAIGAIMFGMMTLKEDQFLHDRVEDIMKQRYGSPAQGDSIIDDSDFDILPPQYYSQSLRDLIKDCLRLDPLKRPDETDLVDQAQDGYDIYLRTLRNRGIGAHETAYESLNSLQRAVDTMPEYRLYYSRNTIDDAPDNYQFDHPGRDYSWWSNHFVHDWVWVPREWGPLYPRDIPTNTRGADPRIGFSARWPQAIRDEFQAVLDRLHRERNPVLTPTRASTINRPNLAGVTVNTILAGHQQANPWDARRPQGPNVGGAAAAGQLPPQAAPIHIPGAGGTPMPPDPADRMSGVVFNGGVVGGAGTGSGAVTGDEDSSNRAAGPVRQNRRRIRFQPYGRRNGGRT